jgi:phosphoacetylglucosamine mutase
MPPAVGPKGPGVALAYGTAGFRAKAELLDSTFFRMGALAVLRSRSRGGLAVGLMVTASHNPERDNGIKLVDPDGGMLDQSWEGHATLLANAADDAVAATLESLAAAVGVSLAPSAVLAESISGSEYLKAHGIHEKVSVAVAKVLRDRPADPVRAIGAILADHADDTSRLRGRVYIARDTRSHSARLARLALEGVAHAAGIGTDCGILTTPQLHHIVRHVNGSAAAGPHVGPAAWASEAGYYEMLASAYAAFVSSADATRRGPLWVDTACGVGAPQLAALQRRMGSELLPLTLVNGVGDGALNEGCGAEYVQKGRKPPRGLEAPPTTPVRACSVDGDADRIVFHYWQGTEWRLLDGDKIAALFASFVCEELAALALKPALSTVVVQTAYANGASGEYIRSLGVPVRLAKTGVKYVHHVATQFDVAIYFEANGHGTLLFSDAAVEAIRGAQTAAQMSGDAARAGAAARLLAARQLVNQAIGDAISDLLLVEAILTRRGWELNTWDALYEDLPSRQTKLAVADRTIVTVTSDETRTTAPADLQPELDQLAARFARGRCFVRPSGTEDVVRVYAEAATQEDANELALLVAQTTWKLAGGVGDLPTSVV